MKQSMEINDLNDDCLRKVFHFVSANDLLNLEFVCIRWRNIQEQILWRQRSLKLFGRFDNLLSYVRRESPIFLDQMRCRHFDASNDCLILPTLDWFACRLLVSKFCNLDLLLIYGCQVSKSEVLSFLISQCSKLRCLSLIHLIGDVGWKNVFLCINELPNLRHLFFFGVDRKVTLSTSTLGRLEHFHIGYAEFRKPTLNQLVAVRRLSLFDYTSELLTANVASELPPNLSHLAIKSDAQTPQSERILFDFVCSHLHALTSLDVFSENGISVEYLLPLHNLSNLSTLNLRSAEKSDLTSNQEISQYHHLNRLTSITTLLIDIDVDAKTLEVIVFLMPHVRHVSVNFSRVCCSCIEYPEVHEIPPLIQNAIPLERENFNLPPLPPPPDQPPSPEETRVYEEDNCESCSEQAMLAFSSLISLHTLAVTGARCKESAIGAIDNCTQLVNIDFATCRDYSLKHLLNVCYMVANRKTTNQAVFLKINGSAQRKIIKLVKKPNNLLIENVDPIVNELRECRY